MLDAQADGAKQTVAASCTFAHSAGDKTLMREASALMRALVRCDSHCAGRSVSFQVTERQCPLQSMPGEAETGRVRRERYSRKA